MEEVSQITCPRCGCNDFDEEEVVSDREVGGEHVQDVVGYNLICVACGIEATVSVTKN